MTEETKGTFKYSGDSKRYHRYDLNVDEDIVGSLYVPRDIDKIPDRIVLEKVK